MYKQQKQAPAEFIDAETEWHSNKDEITFRYVVFKHIMKIALLGSVEWKGGYWQQKTGHDKEGNMTTEKIYIPDTREEYGNAINILHDLLLPHFGKDMKEQSERINKSIDALRIKCIDATSIDETKILGTRPEETAILSIDNYSGKDRTIIEAFRYGKLRLMRKMLQELSKFLKKADYLGSQVLEE